MSKKDNNIFLYSPGGYGPYSRLYFWADHIEAATEDDWQDAADEYIDEQETVDYGCYYMSREHAEKVYKTLGKLLGKDE